MLEELLLLPLVVVLLLLLPDSSLLSDTPASSVFWDGGLREGSGSDMRELSSRSTLLTLASSTPSCLVSFLSLVNVSFLEDVNEILWFSRIPLRMSSSCGSLEVFMRLTMVDGVFPA